MTDGKVTGYAYLSQLRRRMDHSGISAQVKVIGDDPLTVVKESSGPRPNFDNYRETWIVVDRDGQDRHGFLIKCRRLSSKWTVVYGVVSTPCSKVWLSVHYAHVRNYRNQTDAQSHYLELTGLSKKGVRTLPDDFPQDEVMQAMARCHLPTDGPLETDT